MAKNKQIRNIAIVGTGVIGASWAALYLARGLNVTATDPAPNAEENLRQFIDAAWKDLTVIGLSPNASRDNLKFTTDMKKALSDADLVQENGPERQDFKIKLFADMDAATPPDSIIASSSSGLTMSVMQSACQASRALRDRSPFQSSPRHSSGRGRCRRENITANCRAGDFLLRLDRQETDPCPERGCRPRRESPAGRHCIVKLCISLSRACWMLRTRMLRCVGDQGCAGE